MALITLPAIAKFDDVQWTPRFRNQVNRSPWTGNRKVMGLPGGEHFSVSCSPREAATESAERLWRAFVVRLRGSENMFAMPFACDQFPEATDNPQVSSAVAGNGFATLTGIPAGGLKAGMGLTFGLSDLSRQLVIVTEDTGSGTQVVRFEPTLRKNATGEVEAKNPYATVALTKDNTGWSRSQGRFVVAFDAEEAFAPMPSIFATYALALDFKNQSYWSGGTSYALTALPGYTYTRSGAKSELNGTAAPVAFAANAPGVVPGIGYWSRLALTNELVQSQTFDNASWTKANVTVTANQAVAPDGTTTADLVTPAAGASLKGVYQSTGHLASGVWTASVFVKKGGHRYHQIIYDPSGIGYANFDIQAGAVQTGSGASAYIVDCGDYWRLVVVTTGDPGGQTYYLIVDSLAAGAYANSSSTTPYHFWQAQVVAGHHPNGGPIIVTTTAAAALGADSLTATDTIASGDQLFWATIDKTVFAGANDYVASFGVDGNNAVLLEFRNAVPAVSVNAAAAVVLNQTGAAQTAGVITLVAKREGGNWRGGMVRGGALTWFGAATAGAFPTGMNKVAPGQYIGGGLNAKDAVRGVFRKLGTFSTDAAVLAAIAETP